VVLKSLLDYFCDGGIFSPQLVSGSNESLSIGSAEPKQIRSYRLDLWSPLDPQRPIRALFSFVYRFPRRCWTMRRIIREHDITIINPHFPDLGSLLFGALKKLRLFKGKIILSFHLSDVQNALSTTGLERALWEWLLRGADHIVVVSDDLAKDVLALDPTVSTKITTIHNGVDLAKFALPEQKKTAPLIIPSSDKNVLSVGAFVPRKGHDILVRAFDHVLSKVPEACLIIVGGDGPEIQPIRKLINSMSLAHKVKIFKDVPHERIPAFLSQAQLFVLASRREGHPLAVIEAAAAKVPVVCTRAEGLRELITDRVNGLLVDIDDEHTLADAMADLLTHPGEAQRMAARFHEHVKNNLTWGHTYQKYLQLAGDSVRHDVPNAKSGKQ